VESGYVGLARIGDTVESGATAPADVTAA